ncbi:Protein of unknown function [Gryllus bimaculatus]|nr:Protein of unknown function [Gryllus bimaculatus]
MGWPREGEQRGPRRKLRAGRGDAKGAARSGVANIQGGPRAPCRKAPPPPGGFHRELGGTAALGMHPARRAYAGYDGGQRPPLIALQVHLLATGERERQ